MNRLDGIKVDKQMVHIRHTDTEQDRQERVSVPLRDVAAVSVTTEARYAGWKGSTTPATLLIVFREPKLADVEAATTFGTAMRHKKALCAAMFPIEE